MNVKTLTLIFDTWREEQQKSNPQYTMYDELAFLKENAKNEGQICSVFNSLYEDEYEYDPETGEIHEIETIEFYEDHLSPRSRDLQDFADRPPNPYFHIIG